MTSRKALHRLGALTLAFGLAASAAQAQYPQDHRNDDHRNDDHRNYDDHRNDNRQGRPGGYHDDNQQGRQEYRFREEDRGRFASHYQSDAARWRNRSNRPRFVAGQAIPRNYAVRAVPQSYWRGAPPPPPGYQYGYYGGYVVAYNPTTRIIADVLDLVAGR